MDWTLFIDIVGTIIGLIYLWLEYRASIWLWLFGVIMPIVNAWLYFHKGLYADFGMESYYVLAAIYGYLVWRSKGKKHRMSQIPLKASVMPLGRRCRASWVRLPSSGASSIGSCQVSPTAWCPSWTVLPRR